MQNPLLMSIMTERNFWNMLRNLTEVVSEELLETLDGYVKELIKQ
jgi:hypothetical protein